MFVERSRNELLALLRSLRAAGARIAAYGASAKGATLLNYFGIGSDILEYVVDRSSVKQGRYTPGTHLLIRSPEVLADDPPEYLLLLTWNHAEEILRAVLGFQEPAAAGPEFEGGLGRRYTFGGHACPAPDVDQRRPDAGGRRFDGQFLDELEAVRGKFEFLERVGHGVLL
jgi:hypothetical protein